MSASIQARAKGAMYGLAVGGAMGAPVELRPRGIEPVTGFRAGGPFKLKAGQWADDTSMALCLAASLIESNTFDPLGLTSRYKPPWSIRPWLALP